MPNGSRGRFNRMRKGRIPHGYDPALHIEDFVPGCAPLPDRFLSSGPDRDGSVKSALEQGRYSVITKK
jgi:hypothetical protein